MKGPLFECSATLRSLRPALLHRHSFYNFIDEKAGLCGWMKASLRIWKKLFRIATGMISSESININICNSSRVKLFNGHRLRVASSHSRGVAVCRNWTTSRTTTTTFCESAVLLPPFCEPEKKIACAKTLFVAKLNECAFFGAAVSHVENFFDGKHGLERVVRHAWCVTRATLHAWTN